VSERERLIEANTSYAEAFGGAELPTPPARRFAVITCMDARLDPARFLGLAEGDAHVIRNAGGIATDDAIRSLVISQRLLGTEEVFVITHSDCGMRSFSNEQLWQRLQEETGADATGTDFLPFPDPAESARDSLARIRASPLLPDYHAHAFVFDNSSGRLRPVEP
jgi:carbonic anhydrase